MAQRSPHRSDQLAPAPPVEVSQPRPISPFRVPQWTYAGAASLAALALAVLVSVDASGLVAPALPDTVILRQGDTARTTTESEGPTQESAIQDETPPQQAAAESAQVEREAAVEAPAVAAMQAEAPPVAVMEAQAPLAAEIQAETSTEKSLEVPVAQLQMVEEPAVKSVQAEPAAEPTVADTAPVQSERASAAKAETVESLPMPTAVSDEAATGPAQVQEQSITFEELRARATPGTPLIWRILEGAVAALFLVLAAVFFLRRRASRRF